MSSAASLLQDQGTERTHALDGTLTPDVLRRRVAQRRQMLAVQAMSYSLGALVLLIYSYSGYGPDHHSGRLFPVRPGADGIFCCAV